MFRGLEKEVHMKKSLSLLATLAIMLTACNEQSLGDKSSVTSENETSSSITKIEDNYGNLNFDFDESMQNIFLFGKKISLPCKFEDWGDDFSLDEKVLVPVKGTDNLVVALLYKGDTIAMITLQDCQKEDTNKKSKTVIRLSLGDSFNNPITDSNWYNEVIEVDFLGITFNSTQEDVQRILGAPTPKESAYYRDRLVYEKSESKLVQVKVLDGKIVEITLSNY